MNVVQDVKIEKKLYPQHRHLVQVSSSHDGDSGRGDSDPDAPLSEITNETGLLLFVKHFQKGNFNSSS